MKYKVIHSGGFHFGGALLEKGETFSKEVTGADIKAALHFKQIAEVKAEDPDAETKSKAAQEKADREKAEAEAKAKADAEAKARSQGK